MVRKIENSGDDKNDKHMSEQYLLIIHRPGLRNFFFGHPCCFHAGNLKKNFSTI